MGTSYLNLTNRLLRRINDVEIRQADFASVKGVQAAAKDAILDTVREINSTRLDWPFNATEWTENVQSGDGEFAWQSDFNTADWNSFYIVADDALSIKTSTLTPISREQWYASGRNTDLDNNGTGLPLFVFPAAGHGVGISPRPDQNISIKYRYFSVPADLSLYSDTVTIPSKFDYVIIAGALYYMNLFKENPTGVSIMKGKFDEGIRDMLNVYVPNPAYVYDGRVNYGGTDFISSGYYWYKG